MDRLSAVKTTALFAALFMAQCKTEGASPPPPPRVVAVKAAQSNEDPLPAFCDFLDKTGTKKPLHMPVVTGRLAASESGFRWVNLWATWCKPCIEEMPTIVHWVEELNKGGVPVALEFISVDEDPEVLKNFYKERPTFPTSARLTDPEILAPWIADLGLDTGAGLPIHIFTDAEDMVRCARAAAVKPTDVDAIKALFK